MNDLQQALTVLDLGVRALEAWANLAHARAVGGIDDDEWETIKDGWGKSRAAWDVYIEAVRAR